MHTFRPLRMLSSIIAALTVIGAAQPAVPFVLPWDDSTPGITDFPALNAPTDPNARVTVDTNGHFVVNNKRIRFLGMNFAGQLPFTPTNRFTGLPLAKDPAVAFVEIINENGIIQKWLDGGLDRLPRFCIRSRTSGRWNA